jgi:hypothetical protein
VSGRFAAVRVLALCGAALAVGTAGAGAAAAATAVMAHPASDPLCTGNYGGARPHASRTLRLGVDPGIAGSAGAGQLPPVPDDPARDLAALRALRPPHRQLVLRLNRMFFADGQAGIDHFLRRAHTYAHAGFDVELQVRYHPGARQAGDLPRWRGYVRHVVDAFGPNRRVIAMTITNEVNVSFSPNTSDGYAPRAKDALIEGIEAARREAARRHFDQLRFGFTYAYRFVPAQDAAFFAYLAAHGGRRFRQAVDFVGLDFYPGTIFPPRIAPGSSYRHELVQAVGTLRDCLMPLAHLSRGIAIWMTENGVATGTLSDRQQAAALSELVRAAQDYGRTFNLTDYRWFNLRDSVSAPNPPLFATDGLLRSDYSRKPSFAAYRRLVSQLGGL